MGSDAWCECCLPLCQGTNITDCIAKNALCMPHCQRSAPCRRVLGVTTSFMFRTDTVSSDGAESEFSSTSIDPRATPSRQSTLSSTFQTTVVSSQNVNNSFFFFVNTHNWQQIASDANSIDEEDSLSWWYFVVGVGGVCCLAGAVALVVWLVRRNNSARADDDHMAEFAPVHGDIVAAPLPMSAGGSVDGSSISGKSVQVEEYSGAWLCCEECCLFALSRYC